jgi:predicted RNA-binding protein with EMAP domain
MSTDQLELLINLHGSREVSVRLINSRINKFCGLDMNDLPDTSKLCDVVDELQELLDSKNYSIDEIRSILNNIDMSFIEDMVFG